MSNKSLFADWTSVLSERLAIAFQIPVVLMIMGWFSDTPYPLAVFGLSFAIYSWFESPFAMTDVILLREDASKHRNILSYQLKTSVTVSVAVALASFILIHFSYLLNSNMEYVRDTALTIMVLILALPALSHRRLQQGLLILHNNNKMIVFSIILKLITMSLVTYLAIDYLSFPTHLSGAIAFSLCSWMEAIFVHCFSNSWPSNIQRNLNDTKYSHLTWLSDLRPLAMISLASFGIGTLCSIYMAFNKNAIVYVAAFTLINHATLIFKNLPISLQSIWINTLKNSKYEKKSIQLYFNVLAFVTFAIAILFTELGSKAYFIGINNLPVADFSTIKISLYALFASVLMTFPIIYLRGKAIYNNNKRALNAIVLVELGLFTATIIILGVTLHYNSLITCSLAILMGRLASLFYLIKSS